jgi:hypothetical protein
MTSPSRIPRRPSRWRSDLTFWLCVFLASVALISLAVGKGAELVAVGRWMRGVCGEWAQPGWKNDPRCDGSLLRIKRPAYAIAKWSGAGLLLSCAWLVVRRKQARAQRPPRTSSQIGDDRDKPDLDDS